MRGRPLKLMRRGLFVRPARVLTIAPALAHRAEPRSLHVDDVGWTIKVSSGSPSTERASYSCGRRRGRGTIEGRRRSRHRLGPVISGRCRLRCRGCTAGFEQLEVSGSDMPSRGHEATSHERSDRRTASRIGRTPRVRGGGKARGQSRRGPRPRASRACFSRPGRRTVRPDAVGSPLLAEYQTPWFDYSPEDLARDLEALRTAGDRSA